MANVGEMKRASSRKNKYRTRYLARVHKLSELVIPSRERLWSRHFLNDTYSTADIPDLGKI